MFNLGSSSVVTRGGSENNDIVLYRPFGLERTALGLSEGMDYKFTDQEMQGEMQGQGGDAGSGEMQGQTLTFDL